MRAIERLVAADQLELRAFLDLMATGQLNECVAVLEQSEDIPASPDAAHDIIGIAAISH
jgi:hypothetical protein